MVFPELLPVALIFPDTSPRGKTIPDDESFDLGQGAGFYLDAQIDPWVENFKMESSTELVFYIVCHMSLYNTSYALCYMYYMIYSTSFKIHDTFSNGSN